ncbi:TRAF3-interacting protein 1 isoform X2 [Hippocampus zosterae]|uniref:TRAF3-interacting protein 1 isoform X2 n=1 Tax=Hippocampus zosterae TaxID=109293 RepID=UPI00223DE376|nr:TRAF3-interacting protein 1 isoform X2 [Hippocampus zosterae]
MNESVVKKTQEALGKVIKKPPLTEKLLSKPPFRYLHDIFNEIIRTTGFMKGLYKDSELKSDNVKDKETKMAFLQKAIDVVILVSGEPVAAKPARIVAGHEPEKTNELLQAIAKCCLNKLSSEEAVKRILSGEKVDSKIKAPTKSQDKENREGRQHRPVERQEEKRIERSGSRGDKDPDRRGRQHGDGEREHRHDRERSGKNLRREQDRAKDGERDKGRAKDRDRDKDKEHERDRDKSRDRDGTRERESAPRDPERSRHKDEKSGREREIHGEDRISDGQQKPAADEPRKTAKPVPSSDSPARIPRPSSAKGQRRKPRPAGQDESDSEGNAEPPKESGDAAGASFPPEAPSSNKRMARPSSARAAPPPRVKKQESLTDVIPAERLSSGKSSVIREGKKRSDDEDEEDEQFLVAEAAPEAAEAREKESAQDLTGDEKHGGLVKKILETKKDFEPPPSSTKSKEKPLSGEALKKEQDLVTREVERLRASIQSVCQSALPLGKIMDYMQEDIDAMQAELQSWRKENKEHAQALLREQKATDRALEPLKAELYELDQMIKDYQDKICAVRSNILRNEEKIQKKLTGIISSST